MPEMPEFFTISMEGPDLQDPSRVSRQTFKVPVDQMLRAGSAYLATQGYSPTIENPEYDYTQPESEENPQVLPNPVGPGQFIIMHTMIHYWGRIATEYELEQMARLGRQEKAQELQEIAGQIQYESEYLETDNGAQHE